MWFPLDDNCFDTLSLRFLSNENVYLEAMECCGAVMELATARENALEVVDLDCGVWLTAGDESAETGDKDAIGVAVD